MKLDYDTIRDMIEARWKRLGYANLLAEEKDYILVWWLQAEASNGSLHQYFHNSTGDGALDAVAALHRLNAPNAAAVLSDSIALFPDDYPIDRSSRQDMLAALHDPDQLFAAMTDRLFDESEDVTSLAIDRVGDAYLRDGIRHDSEADAGPMRTIASLLLLLIIFGIATVVVLALFVL